MVRRISILLAVLILLAGPVYGYAYRTARGLYDDCAAREGGRDGASAERRQRCADYIAGIFNNWNLNQDNGICSQHVGSELPDAYLTYWRARGIGFLSGIVTSAKTSVNEFLDSQKQPCPTDPKTSPP
jgi:hypothetical protein